MGLNYWETQFVRLMVAAYKQRTMSINITKINTTAWVIGGVGTRLCRDTKRSGQSGSRPKLTLYSCATVFFNAFLLFFWCIFLLFFCRFLLIVEGF